MATEEQRRGLWEFEGSGEGEEVVFTEHLLCASTGSHTCLAPRIQGLQVTLPGLGRERAGKGSKAKASVRENRSSDSCKLSWN